MSAKSKVPAWLISDADGPKASGYEEWKRQKILKGLEQSKDRSKMIPAEQVWRELGLED
jgi:hypothetical protein